MRDEDNETIPIWVMDARLPSGSLIVAKVVDVMEEKRVIKLIMWFVALLFNI